MRRQPVESQRLRAGRRGIGATPTAVDHVRLRRSVTGHQRAVRRDDRQVAGVEGPRIVGRERGGDCRGDQRGLRHHADSRQHVVRPVETASGQHMADHGRVKIQLIERMRIGVSDKPVGYGWIAHEYFVTSPKQTSLDIAHHRARTEEARLGIGSPSNQVIDKRNPDRLTILEGSSENIRPCRAGGRPGSPEESRGQKNRDPAARAGEESHHGPTTDNLSRNCGKTTTLQTPESYQWHCLGHCIAARTLLAAAATGQKSHSVCRGDRPLDQRWHGVRLSLRPSPHHAIKTLLRAVAQLGRALRSGRRGRGFESHQPDFPRFHSHSQADGWSGDRPVLPIPPARPPFPACFTFTCCAVRKPVADTSALRKIQRSA